MNFYSQADPARGIGTGLSDLDSGLRLGYQFSRKFAPYIGYTYSGAFGQTATFSRQAGLPTSAPRFVFGIWVGTDANLSRSGRCIGGKIGSLRLAGNEPGQT
jgi:copper resistance protein B